MVSLMGGHQHLMRCVPEIVQWTASCCSLGLNGKVWARWKHRHAHPPAATPGSTAGSSLQAASNPPPEQGSAHAPTVSTVSDSDDVLQKPTEDTVSQTAKQLELIDLSGDTGKQGLPATDAANDKHSGQSSTGSTPQRFGRGSDAGISGGDNAGSSGSKNAEARPPTASSASEDRPSSQAQMAAPIFTQPTELRASAKPFQPTVNHQPGGLLAPSRDQQPQSDSGFPCGGQSPSHCQSQWGTIFSRLSTMPGPRTCRACTRSRSTAGSRGHSSPPCCKAGRTLCRSTSCGSSSSCRCRSTSCGSSSSCCSCSSNSRSRRGPATVEAGRKRTAQSNSTPCLLC